MAVFSGRAWRWGLAGSLLMGGLFVAGGLRRLAVGGAATDHPRRAAAEKVALGLSAQPPSALAMVAVQQGLFRAEGLDLTVREYVSGKRAIQAMFRAEVDLCTTGDTPVVFSSLERQDFGILAAISVSDNESSVVARRDRGIRGAEDLRGKRVATQEASAVHFFLHLFLLKHGLGEQDVQLSFLDAEALVPALVRGDIDAFAMREPFVGQARRGLGENAVVLTAPGLYARAELVVARQAWLERRLQAAQAVVRALVRAEAFTRDRPQQTRAIVARALGLRPAQLAEPWAELSLAVSLDQALLLGLEDEARWVIQWQGRTGVSPPNYLAMMRVEPLLSVAPEAVTVIHYQSSAP